jgi:hypothetical protein
LAVPAEPEGPCKPGVVPSAEQSCAVPALGDAPGWPEELLRPDAVAEPEARAGHSERREPKHSPVARASPGWSALAVEARWELSPLEPVAAQPGQRAAQPVGAAQLSRESQFGEPPERVAGLGEPLAWELPE